MIHTFPLASALSEASLALACASLETLLACEGNKKDEEMEIVFQSKRRNHTLSLASLVRLELAEGMMDERD